MRKGKMEYQDKETGIIPNSFCLHLTQRCAQQSLFKSISHSPQLKQYNTKMITLRILKKKYHLAQFINTITPSQHLFLPEHRHHPFYQFLPAGETSTASNNSEDSKKYIERHGLNMKSNGGQTKKGVLDQLMVTIRRFVQCK